MSSNSGIIDNRDRGSFFVTTNNSTDIYVKE